MTMTRAGPKATDGFAACVWRAIWPLVIWAAHFVVLYASVEIACELDLQRWQVGDLPALASGLWLLTAVALLILAGFTVVGLRNHARQSDANSTADAVHVGAAVLGLVGVVWSAVALVFAPLCAT